MENFNIDDFGDGTDLNGAPHPTTSTESPHDTILDLVSEMFSTSNSNKKNKNIKDKSKWNQWAYAGPDIFSPVGSTSPKLPRGIYSVVITQQGVLFMKKTICVDDLLSFPDSVSDKILKEITKFWERGNLFEKHGFLHRRGYLLYGPAGSGKSCLLHQIINNIASLNGVVFICDTNPSSFNVGLTSFRQVEPERPVICVFEDIDAIVQHYGEDDLLSLLDGENQINKVLNIATTNYPKKLDGRLIARPRRFDRVIKIGMPTSEIRKIYFKEKLHLENNNLDKWVKETEGLSFAAMAELVISVCCFENDFVETVKILKTMMEKTPDSYQNDVLSEVKGKLGGSMTFDRKPNE